MIYIVEQIKKSGRQTSYKFILLMRQTALTWHEWFTGAPGAAAPGAAPATPANGGLIMGCPIMGCPIMGCIMGAPGPPAAGCQCNR